MITRILRNEAVAVQDYVDAVFIDDDRSIPSQEALRGMSALIDESAAKLFAKAKTLLKDSPQIAPKIAELETAPRLCGGFKHPTKIVLQNLSSFEQIGVLSEWMDRHPGIRTTHTLALSNSDHEIVPIWIKPPKNQSADLFHCVLGSGPQGNLKDPKYTVWEEKDPKESQYKILIDPLDHLEMFRQPTLLGSLLLKSNSYEAEEISHDWRYQVGKKGDYSKLASVELPNQKKKTWEVQTVTRHSAGYNLAKMVDDLQELNILPERHYEDFQDEYKDDLVPSLMPEEILETFPEALKGNTAELDKKISLLFASRMQIPAMPTVKQFVVKTLFDED